MLTHVILIGLRFLPRSKQRVFFQTQELLFIIETQYKTLVIPCDSFCNMRNLEKKKKQMKRSRLSQTQKCHIKKQKFNKFEE